MILWTSKHSMSSVELASAAYTISYHVNSSKLSNTTEYWDMIPPTNTWCFLDHGQLGLELGIVFGGHKELVQEHDHDHDQETSVFSGKDVTNIQPEKQRPARQRLCAGALNLRLCKGKFTSLQGRLRLCTYVFLCRVYWMQGLSKGDKRLWNVVWNVVRTPQIKITTTMTSTSLALLLRK